MDQNISNLKATIHPKLQIEYGLFSIIASCEQINNWIHKRICSKIKIKANVDNRSIKRFDLTLKQKIITHNE